MFSNQIFPWIQSLSNPFLFYFFHVVTSLGSEGFYMILLPLIYWTVDKRRGFRLALLLLISVSVNTYLKDFFNLPRPHGEGVRVMLPESSPGFPSGHAQGSATVWGYLITQYRRRWLAILGVTLTLLVSFSRLYLGVHYPGDVLGGLAIGLALVWLFNRLIGLEIGRDWPFAVKLTLAFLLPLAPLLFYRGPEAFKILGFLAGLLMGNLIEVRCLGFATGGGLAIQVRKVLLGYLVLVALKSLTSGVLPEGGLQALRYGLLSLWVTVVAPFVFLKLGWGSAVSCRLRPGD